MRLCAAQKSEGISKPASSEKQLTMNEVNGDPIECSTIVGKKLVI